MEPNPSEKSLQIYSRLLRYVRPFVPFFLLSILGFAIFGASQVYFPEVMEKIVHAIETKDTQARWTLPLIMIGVFAVRGVGSYLGSYYMAYTTASLVRSVQIEMFNHITRLPAGYYDSTPQGQIIARLTGSTSMITFAATDGLKVFIREGITVIGLLGYILYKNWQLSVSFLAVAPIIILMVRYASKRFRSITHQMQEIAGDVMQIMNEMISGYRVMRSFGGEKYEQTRFFDVTHEGFKKSMKMSRIGSINTPMMQLVMSFAIAVIVCLILQPAFLEHSNTGELVAYLTAVALIPKPLRQLSEANANIQKGLAGAQQVFWILDTPVETDTGTHEAERIQGRIEFRDVAFRYPSSQEDVIKQFSLNIEPGQTVALVGHSGSGKSTLASLILRFYDYQRGQILIDGIPLTDYTLTSLRRQIALVTQHVTLFNDTVAGNIAYGALGDRPREAIIEAATTANAMDFISELPKGLDTEIGDNGLQLSGGQRQRLAIARAILKDAPILILDEATSALDNESEYKIQQALERVMRNRTTLVIAHRLSTIEKADVIVVMSNGRIIETGTHQALLDQNGYYTKLYQMGFEEEVPAPPAAV